MISKKSFYVILIILTFNVSVYGGIPDTIPPQDTILNYRIDEVVITAWRNLSVPFYTPEAVRSVNRETVVRDQLRTVPEALTMTPGVFVQKTNHGGGSPVIRGLMGNQVLLLIDGIRLNNATYRYGPNQYLNTVDLLCSDRIEVLRGGGSVQYGSDAMGGTVHVIGNELTYSADPAWGGSILSRFASHGIEQSLNGGVGYSSGRTAFRAGVTGRNFGDVLGGDTTGRQVPSGYRELDFDIRGKVKLSPASDLTVAFQQVHQYEVPVYHKVKLENYAIYMMDPQKRQLGYIRLDNNVNRGILKKIRLTGSFQHTEEERLSRKNGSSLLRTEGDNVRSLGFTTEVITESDCGWSASSGIETYNDLVHSTRTDANTGTGTASGGRGLYPDGSVMTSLAVFSLNKYTLPGWIFTAGARFNSFIINVDDINTGKVRITPSALVGTVSVMKKTGKNSNLFISAGTGFRSPNIDDLGSLGIVDFRYEIPNYDLNPEHSFQYQAGYKYNGKYFNGEIYLYRNELYDLIVRTAIAGDTIEGYPVYMKENVDRGYIEGIETNISLDLTRQLQLNGFLTYTYGQNITKDEPMRRIPPLFGRISMEYNDSRFRGVLEWLAAAKQDRLASGDKSDNRIPEGGTPGWNILSAGAGFKMKYLKVDLLLENLFNADYRYHGSGINNYGRFARITFSFEI